MARVLSIATDLMLASRVDAGLSAAGHEVVTGAARSPGRRSTGSTRSSPTSTSPTRRRSPRPASRRSATTRTSTSTPRPRADAAGLDQGRAPLADVPRTAATWSPPCSRRLSAPGASPLPRSKALFDVERLRQQAVGARPGRPFLQHRFASKGSGCRAGRRTLSWARGVGAFEARVGGEQVVERPLRLGHGEVVAAPGRGDHRLRPGPVRLPAPCGSSSAPARGRRARRIRRL